ncbi:gas vesicle protein [Streptomyces sp. NPDC057702]|uniref:gas vesicle protein GvpO n=1 Tax=unclassified Streptomyces TaxID=2593676 RepID=UPI0036A80F39
MARSTDDHSARIGAPEAMRGAARQLGELLGTEPAAVSTLRATDTGWLAQVEVVEVDRVPETTSILASYRVELDPEGRLLGYERTRRYARGQLDR